MVDSGSGIDGLNAKDVCPGIELVKAQRPITAITASGEEMICTEVAHVRVALDGQTSDIPFSDLPLDVPMISVRRHVHRGHGCRIREGGGYFRNNLTRKKSRFIEKDGVY